MHNQKGITILEVFIVVSIMALLSAAASPFLSSFVLKNHLESSSNKLIGSIRKAQEYAISSKDNQVWGVCFQNQEITMFAGSCGSPIYSESFQVPSSISINDFSEISFNRQGEPSNTLNITLSSSSETRQVILNQVGGMEIN